MKKIRHLCLILGDQLNADSALFDDLDPQQDVLWMAEVLEESTHVASHPQRIVVFLSAMRHFAQTLKAQGWSLQYSELSNNPAHNFADFNAALSDFLTQHSIETIRVVLPGDYRVLQQLKTTAHAFGHKLQILPDRHFISLPGEFSAWMSKRQKPLLEYWVRQLRKRTGILMDSAGQPVGGQWNFDAKNRGTFGKKGPGLVIFSPEFAPDEITQSVIQTVKILFPQHAGKLDAFIWPVTPEQAQVALDDFIQNRLPLFGHYQDAMWFNEPFLYHSLLSTSLNLKLLNPRQVIAQTEAAYHSGHAPIEAVEGFIRQILGWREYVRGLYWYKMPEWNTWNHFNAQNPLPSFYWTGKTKMVCLQQSIGQVLQHGYGHHIQRLMVTGLFALLWETEPQQVHEWYLAMFVDAVEWVELPNVLGMSQFADGGFMASKPYIASGQYIQKMSPYCSRCQYQPKESLGDTACPFTTLYWKFLVEHEAEFAKHPRLALQVKHLSKFDDAKRQAILVRAEYLHKNENSL